MSTDGVKVDGGGHPLFSGDDPTCIKCGQSGASTRYLRPNMVSIYGLVGPALVRSCRRCDYEWPEAPIDVKPAGDGVNSSPGSELAVSTVSTEVPDICECGHWWKSHNENSHDHECGRMCDCQRFRMVKEPY